MHAAAPQASSDRPCCNKVTSSDEKSGNVVSPPQKPVMTNNRHSGREPRKEAKKANRQADDIAANQIGGERAWWDARKSLLSVKPSHQRSRAPKPRTIKIAIIDSSGTVLITTSDQARNTLTPTGRLERRHHQPQRGRFKEVCHLLSANILSRESYGAQLSRTILARMPMVDADSCQPATRPSSPG